MYRIIALFICFYCFSASLVAEENPSLLYISQYKEIAIAEMERSGIPASIKMAQALLESGAGRSTLAKEANNHFGIKCGGEWSGKTFYRKDDDYNAKGELIKSCFRKFKSADGSFAAHSDFLMYQKRYAFLFSYDASDYHNWAHGLKKAGYATDRKYPSKLIRIIENYKLYDFDKVKKSDLKKYRKQLKKRKSKVVPAKTTKQSPKIKSSSKGVYVVRKGDTLYSISRKTGVSVKDLKKLNGLKNNTIHIGRRLKLK
mgnify:CR=1 FL=1